MFPFIVILKVIVRRKTNHELVCKITLKKRIAKSK